jgi:phospholipid/cholesterol/gamma-HCH transport system substrate-binding protein
MARGRCGRRLVAQTRQVMNERVMQFRIGMFVIVAGLVLTMMIIWFGESPELLRDHVYLRAHYLEAPGVSEGVQVRKSGIRIGEVTGIEFDERPNQPEGVIVTLAIDRKYKVRAGSVPRISRSLIGDVAIDMLPGKGPELLPMASSPTKAPVIEGTVAADPSKALAAATNAFEKVGGTLNTVDEAFAGLAKMTKSADKLSQFLTTWDETGKKMSAAADGINGFLKENSANFQPTMANLRETSERLNKTLDPETQAALKDGLKRFSSASTRLDQSLTDAAPLFKDLGAPPTSKPATDFGQTIRRLNVITSDLNLLTQSLRGPDGRLNPNGSLQMLVLKSDMYDNMNRMAVTAQEAFGGLKPVIRALHVFADRISKDPSALTRGALQRQ